MDIVKFLTDVQQGELGTPEVKKFIEENGNSGAVESGLDEFTWYLANERYTITLDGTPLRHEHTEGGFEGAGDTYYVVIEYGGRLYRIDGWYNSWDGSELDGAPYEVKKVPVEAFAYKPIKD